MMLLFSFRFPENRSVENELFFGMSIYEKQNERFLVE